LPSVKRPLPDREQRDLLLNVVYGHDPQPAACPEHGNPKTHQRTCTRCGGVVRWRIRMVKRFRKHGLSFAALDRATTSEPPPCPDGHTDIGKAAAERRCPACRALRNWRACESQRLRAAGVTLTTTDLDVPRRHVRLLHSRGMTLTDMAEAARCGLSTIQRLNDSDGRHRAMHTRVIERILAIPVPAPRRVDATGTRRRIQAACCAGHSVSAQAQKLGYMHTTVWGWLRSSTVSAEAAADVATLYPTLIANPARNGAAVAYAKRHLWLDARHYSDTNIDDPTYHPLATIKNPVGVYRRLRAMAWDGNGPRQVAPFIGETITTVTRWLRGKPAPAYAVHLLAAAFDELPAPGPDTAIAARARRAGWSPPMAWYDIDIDNVLIRPRVDVRADFNRTEHPLSSQVLCALHGLVPARELVRDEKIEVVRALHMLGWSDRRIAVWLRWSEDSDDGLDAVCHFRRTWKITGRGLPSQTRAAAATTTTSSSPPAAA
jgi:hypothetical protein